MTDTTANNYELMSSKLILASASPRRRELLKLVGLNFEIIPSDADEAFLKGETPEEHVLRLSEEKASTISSHNPDAWVLGADTIVIINREVLGKPVAVDEAREMLQKLSAKKHKVITGFCLIRKNTDIMIRDTVESTVVFKEIPEDEIAWYVRTKEPYDKAGGYAVQGMGAFFIKEIHGSYTNVVGLPICEVMETLKEIGAIRFSKGGIYVHGKG
ncbi:MAG: Maf family protein [Thermodesulfobacteriota bacterium]|nr:Maf family protein [Thermodesulfobacteriota bacterium]